MRWKAYQRNEHDGGPGWQDRTAYELAQHQAEINAQGHDTKGVRLYQVKEKGIWTWQDIDGQPGEGPFLTSCPLTLAFSMRKVYDFTPVANNTLRLVLNRGVINYCCSYRHGTLYQRTETLRRVRPHSTP